MSKTPKPNSKKRPSNNLLRFSGVGFQMLATILIGYLIGSRLDRRFPVESVDFPLYSVVFTLVFVVIAMVIVIREVMKGP